MSQPARVYRIALITPSDVDEARDVVDRVIQDWNRENFQDRRVILMPHVWDPSARERSSAALAGTDLLIGVFWTRLGSAGGTYGELFDEAARLEREGVPVLVFFSRQKAHLDEIDPAEITQLKEFKRQRAGKARVEDFTDLIQFRDKLVRHLDQQIRLLLASESASGTDAASRKPVDLEISFADQNGGSDPGRLLLESKYFEIRNFEKIPDYVRHDGSGETLPVLWGVVYNQINKDYYRDYIKYVFQGSILRPVRFQVRNTGLIGLRDVRIELSVLSNEGGVFCLRPEDRLQRPDKEVSSGAPRNSGPGIGFAIDNFSTQMELSCLQPQRQVASQPLFFIGADRSVTCRVVATIFADALPEPLKLELAIDLAVTRENVDAMEFFDVLRER